MRASRRWVAAIASGFTLLGLGCRPDTSPVVGLGCRPDTPPVEGRLLVAGRQIENPAFLTVEGKDFVGFEVRTADPANGKSGATDLWMVGWDGGGPQTLLMGNRSDRWPVQVDRAQLRYVMHHEQTLDDGTPGGASSPVATLSRVSLVSGLVDSIDDVTDFTLTGDLLIYRKITAGLPFRELHVRGTGVLAKGRDRLAARDPRIEQLGGNGNLYFTEGEELFWRRLTPLEGPVETLRSHVARFLLTSDEKYAVLEVVEAGRRETLAYDVASRTERSLPGTPCCWLGFIASQPAQTEAGRRRWQFKYSESAQADSPGHLHLYDLDTGEDAVTPLVAGLADASTIIPRPSSEASLLVDSQGRLAEYVPSRRPSMRLLDLDALSPSFTADGRLLIYVQPEMRTPVSEGRLMVEDADFRDPARTLSPPGNNVAVGDYFFLGGADPLAFWSHPGRDAPNLYFANPETGIARLVAEGIRDVSVTRTQLIGIVRVSDQGLVGDLVQRSTGTGAEQFVARSVSDVAVGTHDPNDGGTRVAFVVRELVDASRDGLWATTVQDQPPSTTGMRNDVGARACADPPRFDEERCPSGFLCDLEACPVAGSSIGGKCLAVAASCDPVNAPVCGCDGRTYENDCSRLRAGAQLLYRGACMPRAATVCEKYYKQACAPETHYCSLYAYGMGDRPEGCQPLPATCRQPTCDSFAGPPCAYHRECFVENGLMVFECLPD